MEQIPDKLFITGTDTDVGKTVLAATLCRGLGAGYWKPVQAGRQPMTDTEQVKHWTGHPDSFFYPETHCLDLPMSPHAAAEEEGIEISLDDFILPDFTQKRLIVEGAGGVMVPLNRQYMIPDLMNKLGLPVLLVARSGLGTINHTMMSILTLKHYGVDLWGVVLNGPRHPSNEDAIRHFGYIKNLYSFPQLGSVTQESLESAFINTFMHHAP